MAGSAVPFSAASFERHQRADEVFP